MEVVGVVWFDFFPLDVKVSSGGGDETGGLADE